MKSFIEPLYEEMNVRERLNPGAFTASKLISADIALKAGLAPELVAAMLKLRLSDVMMLISKEK